MKRLIVLLLSVICLFGNPAPVTAVGEFDTDYTVDYAVAPSGTTIVTQKVILTNKQTNLYPKQYDVVIDSLKIKNIIARDSTGLITPLVTQKDGSTHISLVFNDQVVGLGKQLTFTIRYENLDVATKNGNIWELYVPGVADDESLQSYSVGLTVPPTFDTLAYRTPAPFDGKRWNKDQMIHGGIAAAYGSQQIFSLNVRYFLENPRLTPTLQEIALPPDTAYQKVIIQSLTPKPVSVRRDDDGNWLAGYQLNGGAKESIEAKLAIAIRLVPEEGKQVTIQAENYVIPLQYWESGDAAIVALAKEHNTPESIYRYVVNTLSYDYNRVNQNPVRRGAVAAIELPKQAICMEFTDLFIAMARAAHIPAREHVGYAYTTNSKLRPLSLVTDVLHSWPEYYDSERKIWVPVDPTWGNTTGGVDYFNKLDFNHITFAIHGISSTYPYPAGSYREESKTGKDVMVEFADTIPVISEGLLTTIIQFPSIISAGRTATGSVTITNQTGVSIPKADISIEASPFLFTKTATELDIPPYASLNYPVSIPVANFVMRGDGRITTTVNGETQQKIFTVTPMYWLLLPVVGVVFGLLIIFWYIILFFRSRRKQTADTPLQSEK